MNSIYTEQSAGSSSEAGYSNRHELASGRPKKFAGRRVFKETRHPVYRGVRSRNNNKWVCEVRVPNDKTTRIWLGTHLTPEMAARAHDVAALALRGKSACLNFADSAWRVPALLPSSNSAKELRRVAMEVAHAFAAEDRCHGKQQQTYNGGDSVAVSDVSSEFEEHDLHDWLQSMEDEPLRSPQYPFEGLCDYGTENWCIDDVDVDLEVSLWSFSITSDQF